MIKWTPKFFLFVSHGVLGQVTIEVLSQVDVIIVDVITEVPVDVYP